MLKSICQECMRVEKTASYKEGEQLGISSSWKSSESDYINDEELWGKGMVFCPHMRYERLWSEAMLKCLHKKAYMAVENGAMVVFEEAE